MLYGSNVIQILLYGPNGSNDGSNVVWIQCFIDGMLCEYNVAMLKHYWDPCIECNSLDPMLHGFYFGRIQYCMDPMLN
jgi:hypothetical protein